MLFSGDRSGKLCFELNAQPVGMARLNKCIVVGCMDETLQCYTTKVNIAAIAMLSVNF